MDGLTQRQTPLARAQNLHALYANNLAPILDLARKIGRQWSVSGEYIRAKEPYSILEKRYARERRDHPADERPIHDGVGLTLTFKPPAYTTENIAGIIEKFKANGHIPVGKLQNLNVAGNRDFRYQQRFRAPNGLIWEAHFRLDEAWLLSKKTHADYESIRRANVDEGALGTAIDSHDVYQRLRRPALSASERTRLEWQIATAMATRVPLPCTVLDVGVVRLQGA